ncbi:hypothetical protein CDAR_534891 [Caerostris darwini]|uniref:Uncharacterized protein n=1 Tax=Caerostris darwini TaxID=1538125 RepID=A0AAV4QHD8_9ARAC|nr:hypothetical protein CDAR_534891 [Caerostris darwini]
MGLPSRFKWAWDVMGNKLSCSCAPLIRKAYRYEDSPWNNSRRRDGHLLRSANYWCVLPAAAVALTTHRDAPAFTPNTLSSPTLNAPPQPPRCIMLIS